QPMLRSRPPHIRHPQSSAAMPQSIASQRHDPVRSTSTRLLPSILQHSGTGCRQTALSTGAVTFPCSDISPATRSRLSSTSVYPPCRAFMLNPTAALLAPATADTLLYVRLFALSNPKLHSYEKH